MSEKQEFKGTLIKFKDDFLVIHSMADNLSHLKPHSRISVFFVFENKRYTFTTDIIAIHDDQLTITQPMDAYKSLQRRFERVSSTGNIQISFLLKGKQIQCDFPTTGNYYPLRESEYSHDFDPASIQDLIETFQLKMKRIVSRNKIIILRNKVPSTYEEKVLAKTGKIIWLPVIKKGFPLTHEFQEYPLLTYQDIVDYEIERGTPRGDIGSRLENIIHKKQEKGYFSQLYCPLFYNEYFVGYIYVCNVVETQKTIGRDILTYIYEFSKVLCYSLKIHGYFKKEKTEDLSYSAFLLDISGSGLLFAYPKKDFFNNLPLYSLLPVTLKIGKRKIEIESQVLRTYKDKKSSYVALKFKKITPEDFRFLYEYIYGKPYSVDP